MLLVVACALAFGVAASSVDHRAAVLALARPVTVGQRLTSEDVRTVRVSAEAGVATIPASMLDQLVGQQVAVSLPAGALLARTELGPAALPAGQGIVAVAVKSGQAPPDLAAGNHVLLVVVQPTNAATSDSSTSTPAAGTAGSGGPWPGVVTGVAAPSATSDSTVVSVQLDDAAARAVAALPAGQIDLVLVPGS
ncbi:MAG TPA: SAF domain-containing protein [Jatrophihabitans sp.]|nr:SAF domain-containing protein [Jatrophihabitans sp.]